MVAQNDDIFVFQNLFDPNKYYIFDSQSDDSILVIYMPRSCEYCLSWPEEKTLPQLAKQYKLFVVLEAPIWRRARHHMDEQKWPPLNQILGYNDVGLRYKKKFSPDSQGEVFAFSKRKLKYRGKSISAAVSELKEPK